MTTPVTQSRVGDDYRVRFMMPGSYSGDSLPTPNDSRVTISEVGPQLLAAIRYRSRWSLDGYEKHLAILTDTLEKAGRTVVGEPIWARYDPPWTPWFQRRSEVLIVVAPR